MALSCHSYLLADLITSLLGPGKVERAKQDQACLIERSPPELKESNIHIEWALIHGIGNRCTQDHTSSIPPRLYYPQPLPRFLTAITVPLLWSLSPLLISVLSRQHACRQCPAQIPITTTRNQPPFRLPLSVLLRSRLRPPLILASRKTRRPGHHYPYESGLTAPSHCGKTPPYHHSAEVTGAANVTFSDLITPDSLSPDITPALH